MNSTIQHTTTTTTWFELYEDLHQYDRVFVQYRDQFYELMHLSVDIETNVMRTETTHVERTVSHSKSGLVTWYALAAEPEVMTDDEAGAILTEIAYSLLDAMAEPVPDEYATRPMPAITPEELEPKSTPDYDVPDSSDRGDEYAPEDWYRDEDGEWYEYDCEDLGIDCDDGDYDDPDAEPVPTDLPPSLLPPSAVTPVTVDYFEAQDKLLAADATGWEPRHLKHLPLLIQVTDVNLTADLLIAALTALQPDEVPF